mmetsp:Transcript_4150/g.11955  ORF Transcript_4150/g.11955 Transcript_4150/m.11955 type:complete len:212 (-) Transcript_4150:807-1442(-)
MPLSGDRNPTVALNVDLHGPVVPHIDDLALDPTVVRSRVVQQPAPDGERRHTLRLLWARGLALRSTCRCICCARGAVDKLLLWRRGPWLRPLRRRPLWRAHPRGRLLGAHDELLWRRAIGPRHAGLRDELLESLVRRRLIKSVPLLQARRKRADLLAADILRQHRQVAQRCFEDPLLLPQVLELHQHITFTVDLRYPADKPLRQLRRLLGV